MKKFLLIAFSTLCFGGLIFAQDLGGDKAAEVSPSESAPEVPEKEIEAIEAIIVADKFVPVGQSKTFDATDSRLVSRSTYGTPSYWWDFGDESSTRYGKIEKHSYAAPGKYTVKLTVRQGKMKDVIEQNVYVYDREGIFISDDEDSLTQIVDGAGENGIFLRKILVGTKEESGFSVEDELMQKLQENMEGIKRSSLMVFHTKSGVGLQTFARLWQKMSPENKFDLQEKLWVQTVEGSLDQAVKLAQPSFSLLRPKFILLTRSDVLHPIFEQADFATIIAHLKARGNEFRLVDERSQTSGWLVFSWLVTNFVTNGISQNVIYLLLVVPFLTFLTSFVRQVVGISTFGVYAPLVLSLSFFVLGPQFGLMVFFVTLFVSYLIRVLFERVELLYIPRLSLLLSALSLSFFLVLGLAIYFDTNVNLSLAIFPMLVMSTISEKFLSAQSEEGIRNAIIVAGETFFVALVGYFLFDMALFKDSILAFPEWILLPILGNIWLGRFTGLRWTEYFRFRTLLRDDTQE